MESNTLTHRMHLWVVCIQTRSLSHHAANYVDDNDDGGNPSLIRSLSNQFVKLINAKLTNFMCSHHTTTTVLLHSSSCSCVREARSFVRSLYLTFPSSCNCKLVIIAFVIVADVVQLRGLCSMNEAAWAEGRCRWCKRFASFFSRRVITATHKSPNRPFVFDMSMLILCAWCVYVVSALTSVLSSSSSSTQCELFVCARV